MESKKSQVQKQGAELQKNSLPEWTSSCKAKLSLALGSVFDLQKQFGKDCANLENVVNAWAWVMRGYPIEKVIDGIGQYIKTHSDIPTPSDIVKIIDPPKMEPVWDKSVYIKLQEIFKKDGPYGLSTEECEYIRGYEENVLKTHRVRT